MAVTEARSSTLQALSAAALLLPGLAVSAADMPSVASDSAEFQYSRYQEGARQLVNVSSSLPPLQVDSLYGKWQIDLSERSTLTLRTTQDTWSGATPITTAPLAANGNRPIRTGAAGNLIAVGASPYINGQMQLDRNLQPLQKDPQTGKNVINQQLVHTMASASPESRTQGEIKYSYAADSSTYRIGGGVSREQDYHSRFFNLGLQRDFNQKRSSLDLALSHTRSSTSAILDHDAAPYITKTAYAEQIVNVNGEQTLSGEREDWSASVGFSQVLSKNALLNLSLSHTRSRGYLANPYKVMTVVFVDPQAAPGLGLQSDGLSGNVQALLEQRPDQRRQTALAAHYAHYLADFDAALHLDYRYYRDDWDIRSHTLEAQWRQSLAAGWSLTPRVRYYSQSAANFYQPYLTSLQAYRKVTIGSDGKINIKPFDPKQLPAQFSSDARLAGFGSLGGGIALAKQWPGVRLELGLDYYQRADALRLGGERDGDFADFRATSAYAALKFTPGERDELGAQAHDEVAAHAQHHLAALPAGLMFAHMLPKAGMVMAGYRLMESRDSGDVLQGTRSASDAEIVRAGCGGLPCYSTAESMRMRMHMLDLMLATSDDLTLMLMPQWLDMRMESRPLTGAPALRPGQHVHNGPHSTGGLGDTGIYALLRLLDNPTAQSHLGLGLSVPTGDVGITLRRMLQSDPGLTHYGMQTGSGTWDFKPSLTYTAQQDNWSWGAQIAATLRLQAQNKSGFAFGNQLQASVWGGYRLGDALFATVRGSLRREGGLRGEFDQAHPDTSNLDFAGNYGGSYADLGLGLNGRIFGQHHVAVEWLQPISTRVRGYQLDRDGTLQLSWAYGF